MPSLKDHDATFDNRLLAALPREEYERLSPNLELVRLTPGQILYGAGDVARYAYFPKGGVVSLLSTTGSGRTIEVGMIGSEGMTGIPIILRNTMAPYQAIVQLAGKALRIKGGPLMAEFNRGGRLQELLLRYTHTLFTQVVQSAACNRFHPVKKRLCRWLLVSHDRVQTNTLHLTQEFLSYMLGVPRTSVTHFATALQKEGVVKYGRGRIHILDRRRLENGSCECYRSLREGLRDFLAA